jgi:hypothetical protein
MGKPRCFDLRVSSDRRPGKERTMGDAMDASDRGTVEPDPMEVESARLLANEARDRLRAQGLDDDTIEELADEFRTTSQGDLGEFLGWLRDAKGIVVG